MRQRGARPSQQQALGTGTGVSVEVAFDPECKSPGVRLLDNNRVVDSQQVLQRRPVHGCALLRPLRATCDGAAVGALPLPLRAPRLTRPMRPYLYKMLREKTTHRVQLSVGRSLSTTGRYIMLADNSIPFSHTETNQRNSSLFCSLSFLPFGC